MNKTNFFHFIRKSDDTEKIYSKNTQFYLNYFTILDKGGSIFSWNWSAFFLTWAWMLYRKMFILAAITLFCTVSIASFSLLGILLIHIFFGIIGNAIYYKFTEHNLAKGIKTSGTMYKLPTIIISIVFYSLALLLYYFL